VIHRGDEPTNEFGRVIAPELKRDSFDEHEPREEGSGHILLLAIRKEPEAHFSCYKIYCDQDLALGVSVEFDAIPLSILYSSSITDQAISTVTVQLGAAKHLTSTRQGEGKG
jgi:hypothetical protein